MNLLVRWLGARYAPWIVIAIGIALVVPAITADFTADDHLHRVIARDDPGIAGLHSRPLDLFVQRSAMAPSILARGKVRIGGKLRPSDQPA